MAGGEGRELIYTFPIRRYFAIFQLEIKSLIICNVCNNVDAIIICSLGMSIRGNLGK